MELPVAKRALPKGAIWQLRAGAVDGEAKSEGPSQAEGKGRGGPSRSAGHSLMNSRSVFARRIEKDTASAERSSVLPALFGYAASDFNAETRDDDIAKRQPGAAGRDLART